MKNSRLLNLLSLFDEIELKQLEQFVLLDIHVRRQGVISLIKNLINLNLNQKNLITKEKLFKKIFPEEKYKDLKMRHLMSNACELIEQWVYYRQTVKNKDQQAVVLLEAFRTKNAQRQFELTEKKIKKNKKQKTNRLKTNDSYSSYLLSMELQKFYSSKNRSKITYINQVHQDLDMFYFIQKLQTACTALNLEKLYNQKADVDFIEPIITHIESKELFRENVLLALNYYAYKLLLNYDDDNFYKLVNHIKHTVKDIAVEELQVGFILAINYCIKSLNAGKSKFNAEIFELYSFGIDYSILLDGKYLSNITFSNVVTIGLRLKRFDETILFIEDKKTLLRKNVYEDYYVFNLSKYYFETGSYSKVIELYYQYKMKEILLDIQSRIIQIKAFYELEETNLCHSLSANLKQLISRKSVIAYHKENYNNIAFGFRQLLKVNPHQKNKVKSLIDQLEKLQPFTEKKWFIEKLNLLL